MTREHVDLTPGDAASSVHPLPRLRGRDREGACNKTRVAYKAIHERTFTPSPTLPRKRGREQTEFAARLAPAATAESRVP
jgi:hypothetical protein